MIADKIHYVIKGHTSDDFEEFTFRNLLDPENPDLESIAEEIGENHWDDDPCDAEDYESIIGVRFNGIEKWFRVTAEQEITFFSSEVRRPQ